MRQLAQGHMIGLRLVWGWKCKRQDICWREISEEMRKDGIEGSDEGLALGSDVLFYPSICPTVCPPIHLPGHPSTSLSIICPSLHLSVGSSICPLLKSTEHSPCPSHCVGCQVQWWVKNRCESAPVSRSHLESLIMSLWWGWGFQWRLWGCWGVEAS